MEEVTWPLVPKQKHSNTTKHCGVIYYQTLEVPWFLRLEKPKKNDKISKTLKKSRKFFFQKIAKICDIKKLRTIPWPKKYFSN